MFRPIQFALCVLLVSTRVKAEDKYPWTKDHCQRLQIAIAQNDFALAESEIKEGADPNKYSPTCNVFSPFTDAIAEKKLVWVQWLFDRGADVNQADANETPLMRAAETGDTEIFEFLLQHGADFRTKTPAKENAFMIAARNYQAGILEYIASHHPELVREDDSLNQALLSAAGSGASQSVRVLLKAGANVNVRDASEATPLILACRQGYVIVAQILVNHGADVNAKENWDETALHAAANIGSLKLIKVLLAAGADPTARSRTQNETPEDAARNAKHVEAARLLHGAGKRQR